MFRRFVGLLLCDEWGRTGLLVSAHDGRWVRRHSGSLNEGDAVLAQSDGDA